MGRVASAEVPRQEDPGGEGACHHLSGHLPSLEALQVDALERLVLRLFRHICASLADRTTHGWETARQLAKQELGALDGLLLVNDIAALVHAVSVERSGAFAFMPTDCPICGLHVSEEEQVTLELLRAARQGDDAATADRARALAGGGTAMRLVQAASALGAQLAALSQSRRMRRE